MQVGGVKKVKVTEIGGKYFSPLDSLNYLGLFPGHFFSQRVKYRDLSNS